MLPHALFAIPIYTSKSGNLNIIVNSMMSSAGASGAGASETS